MDLSIEDLSNDNSLEWHKQIVEDRFEDYEQNPNNVISWEEIKKKWKNESINPATIKQRLGL